MMRRINKFVCLILCGIMFYASAYAESELFDISGLAIEELLDLRDEIDDLLEEKGHRVYFDIERASKGEEVSSVQERLFELGFYTGKITGKFDSETQKAFKAFEKANGLENDGLASREDQIVLFGDTVVAKPTVEPQETISGIEKKSVSNNEEHDTSFDYEHCMRYPHEHVGETYTLKGRVEQTIGNRSEGFQIRFSVLGNSDEIIFVYINEDPGYNILEKDWLFIDLRMGSTVTYESIWGQEITIPSATALKVVLR